MTAAWFFIYLLPILTALVVGLLGRTRRIGFILAVVASILLTPLGGFILTLLLGPKKRPPQLAKKTEISTRKA
jgi:hypothetical protein